ncbi:MAG: hypothetical protein ABF649_00520 [Bacillus sp. (in: firmicutes)]
MKVTIIKGPMFEKAEKKAHALLYQIIRQKMIEDEMKKSQKEDK